jgi:hypothetical protein
MWSLRESGCRGVPHLQRITVPALVIQSTADTGVFPSDARAIHDALGSTDKELRLIAGDHYLETPADARASTGPRRHGFSSRGPGHEGRAVPPRPVHPVARRGTRLVEIIVDEDHRARFVCRCSTPGLLHVLEPVTVMRRRGA